MHVIDSHEILLPTILSFENAFVNTPVVLPLVTVYLKIFTFPLPLFYFSLITTLFNLFTRTNSELTNQCTFYSVVVT